MMLLLAVLSVGLLTSSDARAQESDQALLDQAETHFFQGVEHYRQDKFDDAAISFQTAYGLTKNRSLLFNIARCQERVGDVEAAVAWYRAYLVTKPVDETGIIHRIKQLGVDDVSITSATERRQKVIRRGAALEKLQPIGYRWMKWSLLGGGVASLSIATALGLQSIEEGQKSEDASGTVAADQWSRQAERNALAADLFAVAGTVALGAATYLFISEAMDEDDAMGVVPDVGGASFVYRTSF